MIMSSTNFFQQNAGEYYFKECTFQCYHGQMLQFVLIKAKHL